MGKMSREKGKRWERAVKNLYEEAGIPSKRLGWTQADAHLLGNAVPGDVEAYIELGPFSHIHNECKSGARTNPRAALAQALDNAKGSDALAVAVCKDDRKDPVVLLRLSDWLEVLRHAKKAVGPAEKNAVAATEAAGLE